MVASSCTIGAAVYAYCSLKQEQNLELTSTCHDCFVQDSAAVVAPQPDDWAETLAALCLEGSLASSHDWQSSDIPASVLAQVKRSPVILNLLRTLAYYKCRAESDVLLPDAADKMQNTIQDISDALRTILCL